MMVILFASKSCLVSDSAWACFSSAFLGVLFDLECHTSFDSGEHVLLHRPADGRMIGLVELRE